MAQCRGWGRTLYLRITKCQPSLARIHVPISSRPALSARRRRCDIRGPAHTGPGSSTAGCRPHRATLWLGGRLLLSQPSRLGSAAFGGRPHDVANRSTKHRRQPGRAKRPCPPGCMVGGGRIRRKPSVLASLLRARSGNRCRIWRADHLQGPLRGRRHRRSRALGDSHARTHVPARAARLRPSGGL